jgi:ubiquinone/menaquinone biosynthesis C-methylase UbiE
MDFSRLENFMKSLKDDIVYTDRGIRPSTKHQKTFIDMGIQDLLNTGKLGQGQRVLDVGCGQGYAMDVFKGKGLFPTGITVDDRELELLSDRKHDVRKMDMSFLEFEDGRFDVLWARHCLEHSIMPYFTLSEFYRVLKPEGLIYIEVPAPDTKQKHHAFQNHYSVFSFQALASLIKRSGFNILKHRYLDMGNEKNPKVDTYYSFIGVKNGNNREN